MFQIKKKLTEKDEKIIKKLLLNKSKELVDDNNKNVLHKMLNNDKSITPQNEKRIIDILYKNILLKKDKNKTTKSKKLTETLKINKSLIKKEIKNSNNKTILDNMLNMKSISVEDEEIIKKILSKNVKLKKAYGERLIKKLYSLKKKKKEISVDKSITLYDKFSFEDYDEKVKCKLDKGDYKIYVSKFIKFKNTFTTSMIIIEKDEKINMKDIKITKSKHSINISNSQEIVFEENNNELYKFELEGMQFLGYKLSIYYGKINNKIKMLLLPVTQFI